jgi:hypothetical protein
MLSSREELMAATPEAYTNIADLGGGRWRVEIGIKNRPYRQVLTMSEQPKGLVCNSFCLEGEVVREAWLRAAADGFEAYADHARAAIVALRGGDTEGTLRRPVRRRRELTDEFLTEVVQRHEAYKAEGRPPTATLAAEEGVSTSTVKLWLSHARARGIAS